MRHGHPNGCYPAHGRPPSGLPKYDAQRRRPVHQLEGENSGGVACSTCGALHAYRRRGAARGCLPDPGEVFGWHEEVRHRWRVVVTDVHPEDSVPGASDSDLYDSAGGTEADARALARQLAARRNLYLAPTSGTFAVAPL